VVPAGEEDGGGGGNAEVEWTGEEDEVEATEEAWRYLCPPKDVGGCRGAAAILEVDGVTMTFFCC